MERRRCWACGEEQYYLGRSDSCFKCGASLATARERALVVEDIIAEILGGGGENHGSPVCLCHADDGMAGGTIRTVHTVPVPAPEMRLPERHHTTVWLFDNIIGPLIVGISGGLVLGWIVITFVFGG